MPNDNMNIVTDHALWCDNCIQCLSAANPGVRLFGTERIDSRRVLCLRCVEAMRDALMAQAQEDLARER